MAKNTRGRSRLSTENLKKHRIEFSKIIVIITGLLFIFTLLDVRNATREGWDVSGYAMQEIITTGGIFGASIIFYLNKAKIENLSKGKVRFALLKLRLEIRLKGLVPEESYESVAKEINELEAMLDNKLDGTLEEAIQSEVDGNSMTM
jgi:uncharacterized membrane protein YsdA (DUF1294 family)